MKCSSCDCCFTCQPVIAITRVNTRVVCVLLIVDRHGCRIRWAHGSGGLTGLEKRTQKYKLTKKNHLSGSRKHVPSVPNSSQRTFCVWRKSGGEEKGVRERGEGKEQEQEQEQGQGQGQGQGQQG